MHPLWMSEYRGSKVWSPSEHTRYLQRAIEWDRGGRPANRLLSGDDIAEVKAWAARRPKDASEPTALHLDFIRASEEEAEARSTAQRKQLETIAAAQAERETALHKAEEAQRKRATMARIRNIALLAVTILALVAGWLGWRAEQQRRIAEEQRAVAEDQKKQADLMLARAMLILWEAKNPQDRNENILLLFHEGAARGNEFAMDALGALDESGSGVEQDFAKAREWYEKAADKGHVRAIFSLGLLYAKGEGVTQDFGKARELYEKAADKGHVVAMSNLGGIYSNGLGVAKDYAKARKWYGKAADNGDATAKARLEQLPIQEVAEAERYVEALQLQERLAEKVEVVETAREGKPGEETADALYTVAWYALFAREFTKALTAADRVHALLPDNIYYEINRAHALILEREKRI